jgi:hypothetical protein
MKPINVELLMGHDIGIARSYYKPTEAELLEDYKKAVPLLTILDNKQELLKIREAEDALEKRIEKIRRSVEEDEEKLYDAKKILEDAKKYETTIRDMLREAEEFRDAIREAKKDKKDKKKRNNRT